MCTNLSRVNAVEHYLVTYFISVYLHLSQFVRICLSRVFFFYLFCDLLKLKYNHKQDLIQVKMNYSFCSCIDVKCVYF